MNEIKKSSILPGLLLIFIGILLLTNKLLPDILDWRRLYPIIIMAIGVWILSSTCCQHKKDKGGVFPGSVLFLIGLFFFLRNYDIIPYSYDVWPIYIIILGLGFLALFIVKPRDWGTLIPAAIFLFFGIVSLFNIYYIIDWDAWDMVGDYWPIILILIGVSIIISSLKKHLYKNEGNPES